MDAPRTADTHSGSQGADNDVQSDPGEGGETRSDWSSEGGATPSGPATESEEHTAT
jgi:hypothetical protein